MKIRSFFISFIVVGFILGTGMQAMDLVGTDQAYDLADDIKRGLVDGRTRGQIDAQGHKPKKIDLGLSRDADLQAYNQGFKQGYNEAYDAITQGRHEGKIKGKSEGSSQGAADAERFANTANKPHYQAPMYKMAPLNPSSKTYTKDAIAYAKLEAYWSAYVQAANAAYDAHIGKQK